MILGKYTYADELKAKKEKLDSLQHRCLDLQKQVFCEAEALYNCRKNAYDRIAHLHSYIGGLSNVSGILVKGVERALNYANVIKDARDNELDGFGENMNYASNFNAGSRQIFSKVAVGASAVEGSSRLGRPQTLMALATTFGTTSMGSAITTLGGGDAVNKMLAFLAATAIKSGNSNLAGRLLGVPFLGSIGLPLIGMGLLGSIVDINRLFTINKWSRAKNKKEIAEINNYIKELNKQLHTAKRVIDDLKAMILKTNQYRNDIDISLLRSLPNSFTHPNYPQETLIKMVDLSKTLGKLTREAINIEQENNGCQSTN